MRTTKKITLSAMLAALSVVVLWLGGVLTVLDLTCAMLASFAVIFVHIELRPPYSYLVWLVTSVLALLLLPAKGGALYYAVLFGIYSILKSYYERLPRLPGWALKVITFNLLFGGMLALAIWVLRLPDYADIAPMWWAVGILGNISFVCYDLLLTMCITYYSLRLRPRIARFLK